jgi:hypothetical protein
VPASKLTDEEAIALGIVTASDEAGGAGSSSASDSLLIRQAAAARAREGRQHRDGPMVPKAAAEAEVAAKRLLGARVWRQSVVRVVLPSMWVVEGRFGATETIGNVREWLAATVLSGEASAMAAAGPSQCDLFVSPPRQSLDDEAQLHSLNMTPVGVIRLSLSPGQPVQGDGSLRDPMVDASVPLASTADALPPVTSTLVESIPASALPPSSSRAASSASSSAASAKEDRAAALAARLMSGNLGGARAGLGGGSGRQLGGSGRQLGGSGRQLGGGGVAKLLRLGPRLE